jgi:BMFP domain-containing protein YqiC
MLASNTVAVYSFTADEPVSSSSPNNGQRASNSLPSPMTPKEQRIEEDLQRELKPLEALLNTIDVEDREAILSQTKILYINTRKVGEKLGPILQKVKPELVRRRRWGQVAKEIARVSTVAYSTIRRWAEGQYNIPKDKPKEMEIDSTLNSAIQKLLASGFDITQIAEKAVEKTVEIGAKQQKDVRRHIHDYTATPEDELLEL